MSHSAQSPPVAPISLRKSQSPQNDLLPLCYLVPAAFLTSFLLPSLGSSRSGPPQRPETGWAGTHLFKPSYELFPCLEPLMPNGISWYLRIFPQFWYPQPLEDF